MSAGDVNKAILIGRVSHGPEIKTTKAGEPWRGHTGGVDESFFWGGSTGKRAW